MTLDSFFLSEWRSRRPGEGRSIGRARGLADALGLLAVPRPVLSIVGSKGKGTAATYATAYLAAAGNQVVTVTSPGYRRATERIRVDGRAISAEALLGLAARLRAAREHIADRGEAGGYLAPTGLFTLAGVLHAEDIDADVIVLEAGMGGISDEISLFAPTVAALTPIFAEHLGKLGDTPAQIAREKAAIAAQSTRAVLTGRQSADVEQAIAATLASRSGGRLRAEVVDPGSTAIARHLFPAGLNAPNAELGCAAAMRLLDMTGQARPAGARLGQVLGSVRLPGRLSRHRLPGSGTEMIVDSAINRKGVAAALAEAARRWRVIDHVLICLPDHKDVRGAVSELHGLPVTFVRLPDDHLRFAHPLPGGWDVIDAAAMTPGLVAALGRRVLALGTVYFTGRVLDLVDADTDRLFIS